MILFATECQAYRSTFLTLSTRKIPSRITGLVFYNAPFSFHVHNKHYSPQVYRWCNWGLERSRSMSKITNVRGSKARTLASVLSHGAMDLDFPVLKNKTIERLDRELCLGKAVVNKWSRAAWDQRVWGRLCKGGRGAPLSVPAKLSHSNEHVGNTWANPPQKKLFWNNAILL